MSALYIAGFLRTLFYIFAFFYILKLIARYVLPFILKRKIERMQHQQKQHTAPQRKEGEISIENPKSSSNNADFEDYEEVK